MLCGKDDSPEALSMKTNKMNAKGIEENGNNCNQYRQKGKGCRESKGFNMNGFLDTGNVYMKKECIM